MSPPTAELLDRIGAAFPDSATARHDREFLALIDGEDVSEGMSALCRAAFDDPEQRVRIATLYRRFDELTDAATDVTLAAEQRRVLHPPSI